MRNINEVTLVGYVVSDPIMMNGTTPGVKFRMATNETYYNKKKDEKIATSEFHTIKCWKRNANFAIDNLKKGSFILVKGKIHYYKYNIDEVRTGIACEIIALRLINLDRNRSDAKSEKE